MPATFAVKGDHPASVIPMFLKLQRTATDEFTREVAEELLEYLTDTIENQRYKWKPLKPDYLESKRRKGLDERIYVATGFFLEHIEMWEDKDGVHVGFRPGIIHEPSGLELNVLARILEFGSARRNIPARPLWRPAFSVIRRRRREFARRLKISAQKNADQTKRRVREHRTEIRGKRT